MTATTASPLLSWRPRSVLTVFAVWTGLAVLNICSNLVMSQQMQRPADLAEIVPVRLIDWYSCAVFTPLYVWMARHWPIERTRLAPRIVLWVFVTAAVVPVRFALQSAALTVFVPSFDGMPFSKLVIAGFIPETIAFWAMIGIVLSIEYYDRWRQREVHAAALGRELAEAKLEVLSAQLRPHFLFNTLQGISTLLHRDPNAADQMLARLSDLLRQSLRQNETPVVPLSTELATLENYLAIQRIRFEDRLDVSVSAGGAGDALVPHFILQPIVENAIEHGVAHRAGSATVTVAARVVNAHLVIDVANDARPPDHESRTNGLGLANTRGRLQAMYGADASLSTSFVDGARFLASITIPLKRA